MEVIRLVLAAGFLFTLINLSGCRASGQVLRDIRAVKLDSLSVNRYDTLQVSRINHVWESQQMQLKQIVFHPADSLGRQSVHSILWLETTARTEQMDSIHHRQLSEEKLNLHTQTITYEFTEEKRMTATNRFEILFYAFVILITIILFRYRLNKWY